MMCYKDKTYCPFWDSCLAGQECPDALTPDVELAANEFGLPISIEMEPPECYQKETKE